MGKSAWTAGNIGRLKELWTADKMSAAEIAAAFGGIFSRSAILGQVNRLNLESHKATKQPRKSRPRKTERRWKRNQDTAPAPPRPPRVVSIVPLNIPFFDLEPDHCRYPVTDGAPHLFCGHPKAEGSYCWHHHELCHTASRGPQPWSVRQGRKLFLAGTMTPNGRGGLDAAEFTEVAA